MIKRLLYKWFGLVEQVCETCEVLRQQLHKSELERRELLHKLIDPPKAEPVVEQEEPVPITPQFVPFRVKQQMLEAEDRQRAKLMRDKSNEIQKSRVDALEKELLATDVSAPSGGVKFK